MNTNKTTRSRRFSRGLVGALSLAALAGVSPATAMADDFSLSIRFGEPYCPPPPPVQRVVVVSEPVRYDYYAYAGTLTIDGRDFSIETSRNIASQFVEAFSCMGYWASSDGWNIRVNRSLSGPTICWRAGDYCLDISKDSDQIFLRPSARAQTWRVEYDWSWDWDHGCYRDDLYRYRYCSPWWDARYHRGYSFHFHARDHDRRDRWDGHDRTDRHDRFDGRGPDRWDWREHRNDGGRDHDRHDRPDGGGREHGRGDHDRFDGRGNDGRGYDGRGNDGRDGRHDDGPRAGNGTPPRAATPTPVEIDRRRAFSVDPQYPQRSPRPENTGGRDANNNKNSNKSNNVQAKPQSNNAPRNAMNPTGKSRGPAAGPQQSKKK